jgi:hypothetical protein
VDDVEHILTNNSNKFIPCSRFPLQSGGYLHYDKDAMKWVRSGKVGERGFAERNDDHEKNARKANHNSSNFYYSYPSKAILDQANFKSQLGVFESLEQCIQQALITNLMMLFLLIEAMKMGVL